MDKVNKLLYVAAYSEEDEYLSVIRDKLNVEITHLDYKKFLFFSISVNLSTHPLKRHFVCFLMGLKAFFQARDKQYIIFGEQFVGLYYAFFCRLFFWVKRDAISTILTVIYNQRPGVFGDVIYFFYKWLLSSNSINHLICHTTSELKCYQSKFGEKLSAKFKCILLGRFKTNDQQSSISEEKFYFSGGTSNRDYKTLIDAFKKVESNLVIACHQRDIENLEIPKNVTVRHDLFANDFLSHIKSSYAVILPISNTDVSAGQLVLLDAMRLGKATIITSGGCMEDYVDDSCSLAVPVKDSNSLINAINLLSKNPSKVQRLGENSRLKYNKNFTRAAFAEKICKILLLDF